METYEIQVKTNTIDLHIFPDYALRFQDLNNMYKSLVCWIFAHGLVLRKIGDIPSSLYKLIGPKPSLNLRKWGFFLDQSPYIIS